MLLKVAEMLLTVISFFGLCIIVRARLRVHDTAAPLLASCAIILALMLSGFLHILRWGWLALQIGGIAAFLWCFVVKRRRLSTAVCVFILAVLVYVSIIYRNVYFIGNDTISHWAVAVKYLLRENRFPDAGTGVIHFPSYPLGTAVYVYYFCRAAGSGAGQYLACQSMLSWFALLPLFGFVRKNRAVGYAVAVGAMVTLMASRYYHFSMVVETLLAHMALGATCIVLQYRDEPKRMLAGVLPVMAVLIYIKNSGIFFSVLLCVLAVLTCREPHGKFRRGAMVRVAAISIGVIAAAFVLWQVHFKLAYGNVFTGKHSVSIANYARTLADKPDGMIGNIARLMLTRLPGRKPYWVCLALYLFTFALARHYGKTRPGWVKQWRDAAVLSVSILVVWYLMLFLMYIFSMPADEAKGLDAINRYEFSSIIYSAGVMAIFGIASISHRDADLALSGRAALTCGIAAATCVVFSHTVYGVPNLHGFTYVSKVNENISFPMELREKYGIEEGKRYIYFDRNNSYRRMIDYNGTRYEYYSNDLLGIYYDEIVFKDYSPTAFAYRKNTKYSSAERGPIEDIRAFLKDNIGEYDYLLVYDEVPEFEAALRELEADGAATIQICRSY